MKIKDIILKDTSNLTTRVEFRDGIIFKLRYVPRADLNKISRSCIIHKYNAETKQREPQLDPKRFANEFCARAVVGWEGITVKSLSKLIAIDQNNLTEAQRNETIEFSHENLVELVTASYDLDNFLQESACDIGLFNIEKEGEEKNSKASPIGS